MTAISVAPQRRSQFQEQGAWVLVSLAGQRGRTAAEVSNLLRLASRIEGESFVSRSQPTYVEHRYKDI